ncbi:hypothetical protein [Streptomyces sp. 5-10]|uniref:hypothetical protein n=1 Tax=Streptomyces sp. 5-10 TaxID=878925 RepID=UPI00168B815E|nr:hypothetical protein [Streptomyces sp. 5-10]MBD3004721.1 hypothetical protein [Streptomyces sp. 5-10]
MPNQNSKGPRPVRALFGLSIFSSVVYGGAIAAFTPDGQTPNGFALGAIGAIYLASLYSMSIFVRGEAKASKEAAHLRALVKQIPQGGEVTYRSDGKTLVIRTRPGRVRHFGFTLADDSELTPGSVVELKHYSLLRAPFHMVDTWTGPCEVSADGKGISEVKGKKGPTRRSVWWATPASIAFATREEVTALVDIVGGRKEP